MEIDKFELKDKIIKLIGSCYVGKIEEMGYIIFYSSNSDIEKEFRLRLQFDNMLTYEGYSACLKRFEHYFLI